MIKDEKWYEKLSPSEICPKCGKAMLVVLGAKKFCKACSWLKDDDDEKWYEKLTPSGICPKCGKAMLIIHGAKKFCKACNWLEEKI